MKFDVSDVRVTELARIANTSKANVTQTLKNGDQNTIKLNNNRIVGITPEATEQFLRKRGFDDFFGSYFIVLATQTGGCGKTSTVVNLAAAARRITGRDKAIVVCDTDSQASLTTQLLGEPIYDGKPVLVNWVEGRASLEDILLDLGNNVWLIPSNLDNIYLDKSLQKPADVKHRIKALVDKILARFGIGTKIFFDTPPQLSAVGQSAICAMAQLESKCQLLIPVRPDLFALKGARICITELRETLDTFGFKDPKVPVECFLCAYDARVKVSVDTMRRLLEDPILKNHISSVVVRYSSEVSKTAFQHANVFSEFSFKASHITDDYMDLLLYTLGWRGSDANG